MQFNLNNNDQTIPKYSFENRYPIHSTSNTTCSKFQNIVCGRADGHMNTKGLFVATVPNYSNEILKKYLENVTC